MAGCVAKAVTLFPPWGTCEDGTVRCILGIKVTSPLSTLVVEIREVVKTV